MRVYAWNVPVQVQILSPHPLTPSSCLRSECIHQMGNRNPCQRTPNSCLRTECILPPCLRRAAMWSPNSCLRTECIALGVAGLYLMPLPTHVSARNASCLPICRCSSRGTPNSCLRTECISGGFSTGCSVPLPTHVSARNASRYASWKRKLRPLPTHVSARNASRYQRHPPATGLSQLMSPHGMHPYFFISSSRSSSSPNSCLRTECIAQLETARLRG